MAEAATGRLLGQLAPAQRARLIDGAPVRSWAAGETLFSEGEPADMMVIVEEGSARVVRYSAEGRDVIVSFLGPGDVIGEIGCLGGLPRSATVEAVAPLKGRVVARAVVTAAVRADPELALAFIQVLCDRLADTDALFSSVSTLHMRARLASGLLLLARRHGEPAAGGERLAIKLTQREIGAFVGLSRENVSRILQEWRDDRVIGADRDTGALLIRDMDAIRGYAEQEG